MFFILLAIFFWGSSKAILKALFHEPESIVFKLFCVFFINFNFDFGFFAPKCLIPCVNGVLKFQFFFLNLGSKFTAGVRLRTSKCPYMDKCGSSITNKQLQGHRPTISVSKTTKIVEDEKMRRWDQAKISAWPTLALALKTAWQRSDVFYSRSI